MSRPLPFWRYKLVSSGYFVYGSITDVRTGASESCKRRALILTLPVFVLIMTYNQHFLFCFLVQEVRKLAVLDV
jgi:hypothetical protein